MRNFDYGAAIQDGVSPQDIQQYLQANPGLNVINVPNQTTSQPVQTTQTQSTQPKSNGLLDWLPTAGGILGGIGGAFVPIAGETGLSEIGGAALGQGAGQALENLITGQNVDKGVLGQTVLGGVTGGIGGVVGKVGGKILSKYGTDLALAPLNLTGKQIAQFAGDHGGQGVLDLLSKFGLNGVDKEGLDAGLQTANNAYNEMANQSLPASQQAFIDNVNAVKNRLIGDGSGITPSGAKDIWNNLYGELQDNVFPKMGITTDEAGNLIADPTANPTMADVLKGKKAFDAITTSAQFKADPAKYGVDRLAGGILRNTLNDTAEALDSAGMLPGGANLKSLGLDINGLHDLIDMAANRQGVGKSLFGASNALRKLGGATVGGLVGSTLGNPLLGAAAGVAGEQGVESALMNPVINKIVSAGMQTAGRGLDNLYGPLGVVTGLVGGATGKDLTPSSNQNQSQQASADQQNPGQTPDNQGSNDIQDNHGTSVAQNTSSSNSLGISYDKNGNPVFPDQLPDLSTINNVIPGQTYTPEQQQADQAILERNQAIAAQSRDPFLQEQINQQAADIQRKSAQNQQVVDQYLKTHQLGDPQIQFIQNSNGSWQMLNQLRGLINTEGGKSLFRAALNDNPVVQTVEAALNPRYAQMVQIMTQLGFTGARAAEGGRPSNFDVTTVLGTSPRPGDTQQEALAKLDTLQKQFLIKYQQWAPIYGYTLNSIRGGASQQTQQPIPQSSQSQSVSPGVQYLNNNIPGFSVGQ